MATKMVNGVPVALTQAEIDARAAEEAAWSAGAYDRAMDRLRLERDRRIAETDWWDTSDTPAMSQAQLDYRQALRDITNGVTTVMQAENVTWPTKP